MKRLVLPELLDELPPGDPRAQASRLDLQWVNAILGRAAFVARWLADLEANQSGRLRCLVDLGAGDGRLLLAALRKIPAQRRPERVVLVDRVDLPGAETQAAYAALGVEARAIRADALAWLEASPVEPASAILANLFLHHFPTEPLRELLRAVSARCRWFAACEPERTGLGLAACRLLRAAGCHPVTIHDGLISVRAGFRGRELAALWPARPWALREGRAGLFTHYFFAARTD
jgi:hypothetical protein